MTSVLVIFYSYTGTCRRVAELLCSQQNWPMGEVVETQPRSGMAGTWRCLLDSALRRRPPVRYEGPLPEDFDVVVLIAPVWMQRLAGPMRSFAEQYGAYLARTAVVSVMGGLGAPDALAEISGFLKRAPVLGIFLPMREVDDGSCAARLQAFGATILSNEESMPAVRPFVLSPAES